MTNPIGQRVISIDVLCNECTVPKYYPLDLTKIYRVAINSYMAGGGDSLIVNEYIQNHFVGPLDMDVLVRYLERKSPIMTGIEGRTTIVQ